MFYVAITLLFLVALSVLCVFISNIQNVIFLKRTKNSIRYSKKSDRGAGKERADKEIEKDYKKPYPHSAGRSSETQSWISGITGHA